MDFYKLTPVEKHDDIYVKREDLFKPFDDVPLNGGKIKTSICIIRK